MLRAKLDDLFRMMTGGAAQSPAPSVVVIAELGRDQFDDRGRPIISEAALRTPTEYEARFAEITRLGLAWINMNYCGVLHGRGLVTIELGSPPTTRRLREGPTSINFSGPTRLVSDAGWDALAYVVLVP